MDAMFFIVLGATLASFLLTLLFGRIEKRLQYFS